MIGIKCSYYTWYAFLWRIFFVFICLHLELVLENENDWRHDTLIDNDVMLLLRMSYHTTDTFSKVRNIVMSILKKNLSNPPMREEGLRLIIVLFEPPMFLRWIVCMHKTWNMIPKVHFNNIVHFFPALTRSVNTVKCVSLFNFLLFGFKLLKSVSCIVWC